MYCMGLVKHFFIQKFKIWSSGLGRRRMAVARVYEKECWNIGVLAPVKWEKKISRGKSIGFGAIGSAFYERHLVEIKEDHDPLGPIGWILQFLQIL